MFQKITKSKSSEQSRQVSQSSARPITQRKQLNHLRNSKAMPVQRTTVLPGEIQGKMESSFGVDFSDVNIHKNSQQANNLGALAYTQGKDIHFAPGQYNPHSHKGQELLGHELTHVVQQSEGKVKPTLYQDNIAINDDRSLESEADHKGKRAASGKKV